MTDRPVIGLNFAAALTGRPSIEGGVVFVTKPEYFSAFGPLWALAMQRAVEAWDRHSIVLVDGNAAPSYGFEAIQGGLKHLVLDPACPAFADLKASATKTGVTLHPTAPKPQEHWEPVVPLRKSAQKRKTRPTHTPSQSKD